MAAGHSLTMTNQIELDEEELERLLTVLDENVRAVEKSDAVLWTNAAASRIDRVKKSIEEQVE